MALEPHSRKCSWSRQKRGGGRWLSTSAHCLLLPCSSPLLSLVHSVPQVNQHTCCRGRCLCCCCRRCHTVWLRLGVAGHRQGWQAGSREDTKCVHARGRGPHPHPDNGRVGARILPGRAEQEVRVESFRGLNRTGSLAAGCGDSAGIAAGSQAPGLDDIGHTP